jgi:hypothetical protein
MRRWERRNTAAASGAGRSFAISETTLVLVDDSRPTAPNNSAQ